MSQVATKPDGAQLLKAVSELVSRTYAQHLGKNPVHTRTYANNHVVMCVLRDTLTADEKHLLAEGRGLSVHETRLTVQSSMRTQLVEGIEDLTGRKVLDLITAHDLDPEFAYQTFMLDAREIFVLDGLVAGCAEPGKWEPEPR